MLDEKCQFRTVEFVDEATGRVSLRTIQVIEKTIEHEVALAVAVNLGACALLCFTAPTSMLSYCSVFS